MVSNRINQYLNNDGEEEHCEDVNVLAAVKPDGEKYLILFHDDQVYEAMVVVLKWWNNTELSFDNENYCAMMTSLEEKLK